MRVDDEAFLMSKLPTPLDAACDKRAAREVGNGRVLLEEREATSLKVALRDQAICDGILSITQIAALESAASSYACLQTFLEAGIAELAASGKGNVTHLRIKLNLAELAGFRTPDASQLEPHVLKSQGFKQLTILKAQIDLSFAVE